MKKYIIKLVLFVLLLAFGMGQLGGCLSCTPITSTGSISGKVVDATNAHPISGATVSVGSTTTTTGTDGTYRLDNIPAGIQTVTASKSGYISDSKQVLVVGGQETTDVNFALSPTMLTGQWRIVLTWGQNPSDLDSHLLVPQSDTNPNLGYHVYYANRGSNSDYPYAYLDVDDTTSYGPETITILTRFQQKYKYFVHHYAGTGSLATSSAVVKVYVGNSLVKTYNVPTSQTSGYRYWYVFDINADGTITDRNVIQDSAPTLP
jgi:hypothetical protein